MIIREENRRIEDQEDQLGRPLNQVYSSAASLVLTTAGEDVLHLGTQIHTCTLVRRPKSPL
jgi:hypothetical protein